MKFKIEYTGKAEDRILQYNLSDLSFDTQPSVKEINFDVVVNTINLTVTDEDNRVVQIWGFCGLNSKMRSNYEVPQSQKGILRVIDNLKNGLAYKVSKDDLPVQINIQTGWVCIGNPIKIGSAVEFITNCIAVIDTSGEFISLWLKPLQLPII